MNTESSKVKEIKDKILNKPNQLINMNITGMNKFQHDILDILLHNVQETLEFNKDNKKTEMNRNIFTIHIKDALEFVTDEKDDKQISRMKNLIDTMSNMKLTSYDNYMESNKISNIRIFPRIIYDIKSGIIEYTLEDAIEYAFINKTKFISVENYCGDRPKAYYSRIDLSDFSELKISIASKGLLQSIMSNAKRLDGNKDTISMSEEEFRSITGNYKTIFLKEGDDSNENYIIKYPRLSDLNRYVIPKIEKELCKDPINLKVKININKFGRAIKSVDIVIDKDDNFNKLSEKVYSSKKSKVSRNIKGSEEICETKPSMTYEEEFPNAIDFDEEVENFEVSNRKINEYQYDKIVRYLGTFGAISIENKKIYQEDIDYDTYLKIAKKLGFNGVNRKMFDEGSILNPSDLEKVDIRLEEIESLFK